jgi:hypothetical protein
MIPHLTRAIALCALLIGAHAHAITKTDSAEKAHDITLTDKVELDELDGIKLKSVAHGLRNKKVAFMNFKVYVGEALVPQDATWSGKATDFIGANPAGFQMTFLRSVPAEKMMDAFEESLKENSIDATSEPAKKFLESVKKIGDLKDKEVFIVARKKSDQGDQVLVLVPGKVKDVIPTPAGWSDGILKIWAGKATDSGLEKMQNEIFK